MQSSKSIEWQIVLAQPKVPEPTSDYSENFHESSSKDKVIEESEDMISVPSEPEESSIDEALADKITEELMK